MLKIGFILTLYWIAIFFQYQEYLKKIKAGSCSEVAQKTQPWLGELLSSQMLTFPSTTQMIEYRRASVSHFCDLSHRKQKTEGEIVCKEP